MQLKKLKEFFDNFNYTFVLTSVLLCVLFFNVGNEIYSIFNRAFQVDEFQHLHIAWNIFHFKELIYTDFWDHHGVIYPAVNYLWFSILGLGANISTYYVMRFTSFLYSLFLLFFTYKIAYTIFKSRLIALASITIFSSLFYFQMKGIEIRPDVLQNVFWLAGLYLIFSNIQLLKGNSFYFAGVFFGLAIGTNTKASLGIALVLLFFLVEFFLHEEKRARFFRGLKMVSGIVTVQVCILLYFFSRGGVYDYLFNSLYSNFISLGFIPVITNTFPYIFRTSIVPTSLLLVVLSILGIFLLSKDKNTKIRDCKTLLLIVAIGCTLSAPFGPWESYYLVFLPLLSIISAYAIEKIIGTSYMVQNAYVAIIGVAAVGILLVSFRIPSQNSYDQILLSWSMEDQINNTEYILSKTKDYEAVGFLFNNCGGSVFNRDVQYYWVFDYEVLGRTFLSINGVDAYGDQYVEALKEKNVKYIIAMAHEIDSLFSETTRNYILANYTRVNECILLRHNLNQVSLAPL